MKKFIDWLERVLAPMMSAVNKNVWIQALKDAMMQILPLILVGSLVTMFAILQDFIPNMPDLWTVSNYTMGIIGMSVAFLTPFNYMERKKLHKMRIVAGLAGLAMFAISIRLDNAESFDYSMLGAAGMFSAIVVGILAGIVFGLFGKFSFFKEDSAMPDFVAQWFDAMLPLAICIFGMWAIVYMGNVDIYALINAAFAPLAGFAESLPGFVLLYFIPMCFFYSMGISTWMLYPVMAPIQYGGIAANAALVASGMAATYVNTGEVMGAWLAIGGAGCTLPLVIMMMFSKSKRIKAIGRASFVPGLLNINEPVVFGAIAWNPVMMIPMWINGLVTPTITWLWLRAGLATIPSDVFGLWYLPLPIYTWLVSPGVGSLILFVILAALAVVVYYPFYKVYEHRQIAEEAEAVKL